MPTLQAFECPNCHDIYGALGYAHCPICNSFCVYRPDLDFVVHKDGSYAIVAKKPAFIPHCVDGGEIGLR